MRTTDHKLTELSGTPLLAGLGRRDLEAVRRAVELVELQPGAPFERVGQRPARWWLVVDGLVVLEARHGAQVAGRGDWWGAAEALSRRPAGATVRAFEPTRCVVADGSHLRRLLTAVPELGARLLCR